MRTKEAVNAPRVCLHCGAAFLARWSDVNRGKARYCGKRCAAIVNHSKRVFPLRKKRKPPHYKREAAPWPAITSSWEAVFGPPKEPDKTPGTKAPRQMRGGPDRSLMGNAAAMCAL